MRQYGFPEGNGFDSDREFRAAKARAVEKNRVEKPAIKEGIELLEVDYSDCCDAFCRCDEEWCYFHACYNRECFHID